MKTKEKILIAIILVAGIILPLLLTSMASVLFFYVYDLALIGLLIYYLTTIKPSPMFLVFCLILVGLIGHILGNYIQMIGYAGSILFSVLIIINLRQEKNKSMYYYGAAVAILIQAILFIISDPGLFTYGTIINYFLVGVIGTIKLNHEKLERDIDKGLTFYLVVALVAVISSTLNLLIS